jgi:nickel-dependent lactate racemase
MMEASFNNMKEAAFVRVIIATGSHKPENTENDKLLAAAEKLAAGAGIKDIELYIHDCENAGYENLGTTSRGTPILINKIALDCEVFVVNSDMKPHYFAGYSNGLKFFLPGVSHFSAIENNHSFALDKNATFGFHPLHPDENRKNNPLAQDMLEFFKVVTKDKPAYGVITIASKDKISWATAGMLENSIAAGISTVDRLMASSHSKSQYIIVSCGGYPNDESLYTAQRALELTRSAYAEGAEVLFLAECRNGIASTEKAKENFYNRLTAPLSEVFKTIEDDYKLYAHKAYKLATLLDEAGQVYLYSALDKETVTKIHLKYTDSPQAVIDNWLAENNSAKITIFDKANKLAIF